MEELILNVYNLVGSSFCVESDDGDKVFKQIKRAIEEKKKVKLDFINVEMLTSAFLNSAIGQLYRDFNEELVKKYLNVKNMQADDIALLKRVIDTAKLFFKEPDRLKNSIYEILGEDNENTL